MKNNRYKKNFNEGVIIIYSEIRLTKKKKLNLDRSLNARNIYCGIFNTFNTPLVQPLR